MHYPLTFPRLDRSLFRAAIRFPGDAEGRPCRSVVIPVFNGAATIAHVVRRLYESDAEVSEIVLVDDGSTDESEQVCRMLASDYPGCVTFVQLGRNCGEHAAVAAGLRYASGAHVAIVDDDGQQSPDDVARLF